MGHTEAHDEHELIGYGTYISIWLALLCLTALTVAVSGLHLGQYNLLVAMIVAVTKTTLVLLYFMHLRYENRFFHYMLLLTLSIMAIVTVILFLDNYRFTY